ncbi:ROK family protein [Polyangium sorediatum]|uniref:ROK family protein n=1 Tax=Polyangium sorediatum TaxID=889274 RepID=A0ABT6NQV3_9BACT|nr:ROK family protein [Polyangium sorediatum]MDI1430721.1 ROK family protein [Polyangium sorediatum]
MRTLVLDIGGTGLKGRVLDGEGNALTERVRVRTPAPADPEAVLAAIAELIRGLGDFDRVSVGFPGVVTEGTTRTAPHLDAAWAGFPLAKEIERRTGKPARVINDAGLHGFGVIEGRGTEILITLGTGMGFALYVDGHYVPNIELGHHPFRKRQKYEDRISNEVRKKVGKRRWNTRVRGVIAQIAPIFNHRKLYLGGGNARHVEAEGLPSDVVLIDNVMGLRGGVRLWSV